MAATRSAMSNGQQNGNKLSKGEVNIPNGDSSPQNGTVPSQNGSAVTTRAQKRANAGLKNGTENGVRDSGDSLYSSTQTVTEGTPYTNGHSHVSNGEASVMDNLGKAVENFEGEGKKLTDPHAERRNKILKKYPEIKKLMGPDTFICWVVAGEILAQLLMCYLISVYQPSWWMIGILSVVVGGTINHSIAVAIHECSHNLVFGHNHLTANKVFGLIANLPLAVPLTITYKKYHMDHHRMLGQYEHDTDIPWTFEHLLLKRWYTKIIWLFILPIILAVRPFFKDYKQPNSSDYLNTALVIMFNLFVQWSMGWTALFYLLASTVFGMGIHPSSGHFLAKHYLHDGIQATHSYYGPMNLFVFNVGYHNEHHDFPYIAYHKLPKVREIAAEFYDMPHHTSWLKVIYDFLTTEDYGPYAYGVGYGSDRDATIAEIQEKKKVL